MLYLEDNLFVKEIDMALWLHWWNAVFQLRPACTRLRTFLWFAAGVAGLTVRTDTLGVTSIVRALRLHARFYDRLLDNFHSHFPRLFRCTIA